MFNIQCVRSLIFLFLCITISAMPAQAQQPWCGVHMPQADHPLSWSNLQPPVQDRLDAGDYEGAYKFIVDAYAVHYGDQSQGLVRALRQKLARYLTLREKQGERPSDWRGFLISSSNTYNLTLEGESPSGSDDKLHSVSCASDAWASKESPEVAVFYAANAMQEAAGEGQDLLLKLAANEADAIRRSHHDWLLNGFAMWPWEFKVNEFRIDKEFNSHAPEWQLTLLRPSPALAIRSDSLDRTELDTALVIEPIGYVRYIEGSRYQEWWGLSPIVTVTDDNGAGYGLLARYNEFVLGAAHHESVDEVLVYFTVDLYQYLLSHEEKIRRAHSILNRD